VGLGQNRQTPIKYNIKSPNNTMEISQETIYAFKKREFNYQLIIKLIEYVLANNKNELIEKKYSRFTGLNTSKCQEYLVYDTLLDVIKGNIENLKPYANLKQVKQRDLPPRENRMMYTRKNQTVALIQYLLLLTEMS